MNPTPIIIGVVTLVAVVILVIGLVSASRNGSAQSEDAPGPASVTFDDVRIRCVAGGKTTEVRWDDLIGVAIKTTDDGPFLEDVFYVLGGEADTIVCPSGAEGTEELLTRLQQLPGFDNEAVIAAMTSTSNQTYVCWDKKA